MDEYIVKKVHELHESCMEMPRQVLKIFEDFYGEDRVDLQNYISEQVLYNKLDTNILYNYLNDYDIESSSIYKEMSMETKSIVDTIISENPFNEYITKDRVLMEYLFPFLYDRIRLLYNEMFILVKFPTVRITNENNKFVDIKELWAKVPICSKGEGKGYFSLNRSNYSLDHFLSGYMHSHIHRIPINDFTVFQSPCTGNGPINKTLSTLAVSYDESIWQLFCLELDRYVRVESIAGTPYHYLEKINKVDPTTSVYSFNMYALKTNHIPANSVFSKPNFKQFIKYLLESKKLTFNYGNGSYGLGMSFTEAVVLISNEFITWYNKGYSEGVFTENYDNLLRINIMQNCTIMNNTIYLSSPAANIDPYYKQYIGHTVCTFKGKTITLNIEENTPPEKLLNITRILHLRYIDIIVYSILNILNYKYGRKENTASIESGQRTVYL